MAQSRNRKKHYTKPTPAAPKKAAKRKIANVRLLMILFFGIAGLAIGYLWTAFNTGMIGGAALGIAGGFLLSFGLLSSADK